MTYKLWIIIFLVLIIIFVEYRRIKKKENDVDKPIISIKNYRLLKKISQNFTKRL